MGMNLMAVSSDLIMLFLSIETASIPMYLLAGFIVSDERSTEAGFKYLLFGILTSTLMLYGFSLIFGFAGTTNIYALAEMLQSGQLPFALSFAVIALIIVGLGFKVTLVPFHFWAPDVYQGSPTIVTVYMSTVVKTAAFAAFLKLFMTIFGGLQDVWFVSLWIIAAATILIGNITAVFQSNVKRMLAYSSISHAGYMLIAILAMNDFSSGSLLFYTLAYSLSSLSAFALILIVYRKIGSENLESFYGLAKKNPLLAFATVISMLSLAGIPPTAGFFAKYYIFSSDIQSELTSLVIIAIGGSLIGVFYYFRLIIALFKEKETDSLELSFNEKSIIVFTSFFTLLLGIMPGLITDLLK
jgi:NADH-quinone oxidoreductase subunit N